MKKPDFITQHIPRHPEYELTRYLIEGSEPDAATRLKQYVGIFSSIAQVPETKSQDLLEAYGLDLRLVEHDIRARPTHYTERQHEIVDSLLKGTPIRPAIKSEERSELLLTYMRPTKPQTTKTHSRKPDADLDEIELMDGRTLRESLGDESFEKQNFGDKIIV